MVGIVLCAAALNYTNLYNCVYKKILFKRLMFNTYAYMIQFIICNFINLVCTPMVIFQCTTPILKTSYTPIGIINNMFLLLLCFLSEGSADVAWPKCDWKIKWEKILLE